MLQNFYLSKSKIRNALLGLLFSNPAKHYYLSELARLIKTSPGNVQRELRGFIKDGLIQVEKKGNLSFHVLNQQHALFNEIAVFISKTSGMEGALRELVCSEKDIALALLYGSFARGEGHGQSDVDLLIVSDKDLRGFYSRLRELEKRLNRDVNPTVYSSREWSLKISEKNPFVMNVLKKPHQILKGDLAAYAHENSKRTRKSA